MLLQPVLVFLAHFTLLVSALPSASTPVPSLTSHLSATNMAAAQNSKTLRSLWRHMGELSPTTPNSTLTTITSLFTPIGTFYLNGMSQPPATSTESLLATLQALQTYWTIVDSKTVHTNIDEDGSIVNALENTITILGETVAGLPECEVVKFDGQGRIKEYLLYLDPARILAVFAQKAGAKDTMS